VIVDFIDEHRDEFGVEITTLWHAAQTPGWTKRAQCCGEDRALFFPALGANAAKARTICSICPIQRECLAYALTDPESAGVWAGLTELERRKLRSVA
jgi:WhiB family redox-sensing transcriptional regulator